MVASGNRYLSMQCECMNLMPMACRDGWIIPTDLLYMPICMQAAQNVLVEHWAAKQSNSSVQLRQLDVTDLLKAAADVRPSVTKAQDYSRGMHGSASFDAASSSSPGLSSMVQMMAALAASTSSSSKRSGVSSNGEAAASSNKSNSKEGTLAADAAEADQQEQDDERRNELYRLVGKMVLGSIQ